MSIIFVNVFSVLALFDAFAISLGLKQMFQLYGVRVMVFNATFNNISAISWRSALLVEETEVPEENY
jgi:hypothetical protein